MKKIVKFYKVITGVAIVLAVGQAALGYYLDNNASYLAALFFVGLAAATLMIANHVTNLDASIRQGFMDHMDIVQPKVEKYGSDPALMNIIRNIRLDIEDGGPLVNIAHRTGVLNSLLLSKGIITMLPNENERVNV